MSTTPRMRTFRLLLLAVGGLAVALAALAAVVFSSTFQTWVVRRTLAGQPHLGLKVGAVSAGLGRVELREVEWVSGGVVAQVPWLEARLPLWSAWFAERVEIAGLKAHGWSVTPAPPETALPGPVKTPAGPAATGTSPEAALAVAGGFLARLQLPFELSVDGVDLAGEVRLGEGRGRILFRCAGGGFAAGQEGRLELATEAMLTAPQLGAVTSRGVLTGRMESARAFSRVKLEFQTSARGARFPAEIELSGELAAERGPSGESYLARVISRGHDLLRLTAEFPRESGRWQGEWKADFSAADLAALALGLRTPAFAAIGSGRFEWEPSRGEVQASGRVTGTVDELGTLRPELERVGRLTVTADFDLGGAEGVLAVRRFEAAIAGDGPVATLRALQPFSFHPARGELIAVDTDQDLAGISVQGLPTAWFSPWLGTIQADAGPIRGELLARSRGRGLAVRSHGSLTVEIRSLRRSGAALLENLGIGCAGGFEWASQGWMLDLAELTAASGGRTILKAEARAGQLVGPGEALKLGGRLTADLPAWLAQPGAAGLVALRGGELAVDFGATLGASQSWHVKTVLQQLKAAATAGPASLPALAADLRADLGADGKLAYHVPITIENGDRKSDLLIEGTGSLAGGTLSALAATATSRQLQVEDLQMLVKAAGAAPESAGVEPGARATAGAAAAARAKTPPWSGWSGTATLRLEEVIYGETFRLQNVTGKAELEAGKIRLEGLEAGFGHGGRAHVNGALTFEAGRSQPYALAADVELREFEVGAFQRRSAGGGPPLVEGRFDVIGGLTGHSHSLGSLGEGLRGEFHLASRGGVFRGLPVALNLAGGTPGRRAGILAAAGQAIGGLARRREEPVAPSRAEAASEFAAGLNPIVYDQLSVSVIRDPGQRTTFNDFALIAPELRLTGTGTLADERQGSWEEGALAMEYRLRVRGRQGELLRFLGAVDATADDLGYAACTLPIRVRGTWGRPDASDLNVRLQALALEKGGVAERASELFNRLIGGGK